MAIARLTGQDALGTSATTSVTATYASTPTLNNTLIAVVWSNTTTGTNTLTGWTKGLDVLVGNVVFSATVFYKVSTGAESTTVTATAAGAGNMRIHVYEYSGISTTNPLYATNNINSGAATVATQATGNLVATLANQLLFVVNAVNAAVTLPSWNNSFNIRQQDASIRIFDGDRIISSTGTYTSTAAWTTAVKATTMILAFNPAGQDAYAATGTWVAPTGVTSVQADVWGAGGGGGGAVGTVGGSGAGGGAYSGSTTLSVTPGNSYTVTVGTGGPAGGVSAAGTVGNDSWFNSTGTILAKGGGGGGAGGGTVGSGGASGSGVGTTKNSGGNGGVGSAVNNFGGGGGGAGTTNVGGNATTTTAGTGGATGGGAGGTASVGNIIAGGGAGGSAGARGEVQLTYSATTTIPNKQYSVQQAVKRASFF